MDAHLDTHFDYFPRAWPIIAQVKAVVVATDDRNPTQAYTLYDVAAYPGRPSTTVWFELVPALHQFAGGTSEQEDPYEVGQQVMLGFRDGDPNLPFIFGAFPDLDTSVEMDASEQPRTRYVRRGVTLTVDKNGNAEVSLASTRSLKIKDNAGVTLLEIINPGGGYEVHLGGDSFVLRLLTENFVSALNALFAGVVIVPGDGGAAIKTALTTGLNAALTTANSTAITKAK